MRRKQTQEEKVYQQIEKLVSDLRLDLDYLGWLIAYHSPNVVLRRLEEITETARYVKNGNTAEE